MPRSTPSGSWATLVATTSKMPEIIELVTLTDPSASLTYYYATEAMTWRLYTYSPRLRKISGLTSTLNQGLQRATIVLTNADLDEAQRVASPAPESYVGWSVYIGKILNDTVLEGYAYPMAGYVVGYRLDENVLELDVVTQVNRAPTLSKRRVQVKCPWEFKGTECGYVGVETTCNKLYVDAGGCSGRSNQFRFGGFPSRPAEAAIKAITDKGKPPAYQLISDGGSTYKQQTYLQFPGATISNDDGNFATVVTGLGGSVSGVIDNVINVKDSPYYAAGVTTATTGGITSGTDDLVVASATSWSVGQGIRVAGAGTAGADLVTTISAISGTAFTLAANASTTVVGAAVTHDDTVGIQAAIDAAEAGTTSKTVYIPPGTYNVTGLTAVGNITILGTNDKAAILLSTTNAVILNCSSDANFLLPRISGLTIRGSTSSGSSQIGLKVDDGTYGYRAWVYNLLIEDCGSSGLYIGNAFSSHFEHIYSTNCAGGNYVVNSANMPVLTLKRCDSGVIHDSYRTGYHVKAGNVVMRDCNSIYGGNNPEWCVTIGRRVGQYGEATANGSAFVRFENCNFESSEVGGVQCFFNSRASFHSCTWVGAGGSSGSYKAVLYDVCQYNPTETTGSITSGTPTLTVASATTWTNGQGIKVAGAGVSGGDLTTTVSNVVGTTITLNANASTTVVGATVSHTDDIFYPLTQSVLGMIDDDCGFSQSPASYYANSEPIHVTAYPTTAGVIPPLAVNGRGPKISGDKFVSDFYNDSASKARPLPRMDGFMPVQTVTTSTTYDGPGVRYIECNHSAPITITLPWPGWMLNTSNEPIIIKDRSSAGAATNNITISAGGGGTVNGSSYTINTDKGAVILMPHSDDDYRVVAAYTGAAGNVTGPVSATDTAIARFNGTTGKILQNSGVTIDGSNHLTTPGYLQGARVTATNEIVSGDAYFTGYSNSPAAAPSILYRRARGTSGTPAAVQSGDVLYYLYQSGHDGSGFAAGGYLYASASENWTGSAHGTVIALTAAPNGSTDGFAKGIRLDPTNSDIEPIADQGLDLGRASYRWRDAHIYREIVLYNASNSNTLKLKAGATSANTTLTLPTDDGTSGQFLKTDGSGVLSWDTPSSGANTALSNLASVAINTTLLPGADNTHDLGSATYSWRDAHVERDIHAGRVIQSSGSAMSYTAGTGAGTSPTITIDGNGIAGAILLTTGTTPATSSKIVELTLPVAATNYPVVILTPANAAAAALSGDKKVFVSDADMLTNKFTIKSGATALTGGIDYVWYFHVINI